MLSWRIAFVASGVLLAGLLVAVYNDGQTTGITVDGHPLDLGDAKASAAEVHEVASALDDPNAKNIGSIETKTDLGRLIKEMGQKIAEVEGWHQEQIKDLPLDKMMDAQALRSQRSLKDALSRLSRLKAIEGEWIKRRCDLLDGYVASIGNAPHMAEKMDATKERLRAFLSLEERTIASVGDYLHFALRKRPRVDTKGNVVYWSPDDLPEAKRLGSQIDARLDAVTREENAMKRRSEEGAQNLEKALSQE